MLLNSCLINSQRRPWILLFLNKLWKQSFFTEVYSTKCRKRWFRLTIIITQHKIFFREWKIQLLRKKLFWAIFTTLCLDVLLKIFYHYWHKKTSKKTVEQYKSDQTFALIQNDTKCWMFGISKFREHRLELFRMLYTLGYFNYIQYCVLFLHLNRVLMKWKDD